MSSKSREKLKGILQTFDNAMLTTIAGDGSLQSRPMRIAETTETCEVWFVTSESSGKTEQIAEKPQVNVSMQSGSRFMSLSGSARVVNDPAKVEDLWNDTWKVWFPNGKTDPSIRLIHVDAKSGEFWDMSGTNAIKYLLNAGKAYFSGEQVEVDSRMNAKVTL